MVFRALSPELWGLGMDKGRTMPPLKFHDAKLYRSQGKLKIALAKVKHWGVAGYPRSEDGGK